MKKSFITLGPGLLETMQGIGKLSISRLTKDLKGLGKHSVSLPAKDCLETGNLSIFRIEKDIAGYWKAFCVLVCLRLRGLRNVLVSVSLSTTDNVVPQKAFNCTMHEKVAFVLTCQRRKFSVAWPAKDSVKVRHRNAFFS